MKTRYSVSSKKAGRSAANGVFTSVKSRDSKMMVMDAQTFDNAVSRAETRLRQVITEQRSKATGSFTTKKK